MALTQDGRYAYLSFDLSPFVFKVRLSDMTVVASADFSRYFPLQCSTIALDGGETKAFLLDHSGRLLVVDAATLQEIRFMGGFAGSQLVRSRWGPYLILAGGSVWLINTDTLEVTALANSRQFSFIRESATDPAIWYAVSSGPVSTEIGTYDYKKALWSAKATLQPRAGGWAIHDFAVLPDGSKAYAAAFGAWYPDNHAFGWVYAVDLQEMTVKELPVDGGALQLAVASDGRRVYVGAGWPVPATNVIQVLDTQTDAPVNVFQIARQKFGWYSTQINKLELDSTDGHWLYATSSDGNDLLKLDSQTGAVSEVLVLNEESNSPSAFVRQPGASRGYLLLSNSIEALELDLDGSQVTRVAGFPITRTDVRTFGVTFKDSDTLLISQGRYFLETGADLRLRAQHNLPSGTSGIWDTVGSRDGRTVYAVSNNNILVAIDSTSFQVRTLQLDGGTFNRPWEHPDAGKLYVLGGMQNGAVQVHVVDAKSLTLRKTISFDDPKLQSISAGPYYPYAYDPKTRLLFVGATLAVLAIDTDRDEIKQVIRLYDLLPAMGLSRLTAVNAVGLVYHPGENCLYIAHLDGSFMSIYDLSQGRFLSTLIPFRGYFAGVVFANDDASKIWVSNPRSDGITVIDTKTKTATKLIDIHACNPFPGRVDFAAGGQTSQAVRLSGLASTGKCTVSIRAGWLTATPVGSAPSPTFDVTVDPSVFGPGTYRGTVDFQTASLAASALDVGLTVGSGASSVRISSVADGAGFGPVLAPGSWAAAFGSNLAPATRAWRPGEIVEDVLPTRVEGVGVTVNGRDAAVYVVSPTQINFQVPGGLSTGTVNVQVSNNGAPSNTISASLRQAAPELFRFLPSTYAVALHTNYRIAAKPDLFPGCNDATLCPASEATPGETILLYGTGFGATTPVSPAGRSIGAPMPVAGPVQVRFGNTTVDAFGWLVSAGLYQINVKVPDAQADGDVPLTVLIGGTASAAKAQLTVKRPK